MYAEMYCRDCGHHMDHHFQGKDCILCTKRAEEGRPQIYFSEACVAKRT